ncbi:MAG: OmpA family protein [Bacteroidetes bacterium]|nr:OmpA family protein [Bacteroidota bacterium]
MRAFLVFFLFCVYALFARWYYVCEIRNSCGGSPQEEEQKQATPRPQTLDLMLGDSVILQGYEQFAFEEGSVTPELSENNREFLEKVAEFFKHSEGTNLTITGHFRENEKDMASGFFENLGVARASESEKLLVQSGINEERISLDYEGISGNELPQPLVFNAYTPEKEAIPDEYVKTQFSFTDMTYSDANFEYNSDAFRPGDQFVLYADSVKTFLELNPDKMLTIVGHTDSIASQEYNENLGLRRAESARDYFRDLGMTTTEITVASKGEQEPVTSNSKKEGRQKNRRVNFIIN